MTLFLITSVSLLLRERHAVTLERLMTRPVARLDLLEGGPTIRAPPGKGAEVTARRPAGPRARGSLRRTPRTDHGAVRIRPRTLRSTVVQWDM